ncbi:zinc finger RNA-binding protein-like [Phoenix dactylifera]|uniref:Zinc finger RNA-binding protein-like n=1 Tax=Phoenix dactylifera TaxID=42345 RepID=A0A8B7CSL2_PHODC|nr:zinc finger RNA-binding protein-like [Phoenix dactylifera]
MDYGSRWEEPQAAPPPHHHLYYAPPHVHPDMIHHHQQPQPLPHSSSSAAAAAAYYYPNPNPNPNRCPTPTHDAHLPSVVGTGALRPPAADIYPPNPYAPHGGYHGLHAVPYSYPGAVPPAATAGVGAPSPYYYGGGGENPHSLAAKAAIRQYGFDPQSYGPVQASSSNGLEPTDPTQVRPPPHLHSRASRVTLKKAMKKGSKRRTTKIVQSAYCEVCKIECNTPEVLKTHKQGKKHKKKLQKLQESITAKPTKAPTATVVRKETPDADKSKAGGEKTKKKGAPATAEELEAKKRRVLEGGAAAEGVKVCSICNVVVNSQVVFEYHIAGQKHTAAVKKLQEEHQATDAPDIVKQ